METIYLVKMLNQVKKQFDELLQLFDIQSSVKLILRFDLLGILFNEADVPYPFDIYKNKKYRLTKEQLIVFRDAIDRFLTFLEDKENE